ncbi:hypothetical protein M6B38_300010 [Iris pallida]|uniref:Uncharacterized protein n=1 Tax=Iris pallida TaxID=29817 RepID=A0AAX6HQS6_IRIPA|nr:hypothetical protein M6B38_300010 [Iris pallida]
MYESLWNIEYRKGERLGVQAIRTWDNCINKCLNVRVISCPRTQVSMQEH